MRFVLLLGLLGIWMSCKVSLSGIAIPEEAQTVTVENFGNTAALTNPAFPQQITEDLRTRFISQTRLRLVQGGGDLQFKGAISRYATSPVAVSGSETAALTRLTVSISVDYINTLQPEKSFKKSFTRFADFEASQPLSSVENTLLQEISEQLIQDVFNEAFLDW